MSNTIRELTQALRDAATKIEAAAKFRFTENIDLSVAVAYLTTIKKNDCQAKIIIQIELPYSNKSDEVKVKYSIDEAYREVCNGDSFQGVITAFAESKEGKDSLASVARLIKEASKESSQDSPTVLDSPTTTL